MNLKHWINKNYKNIIITAFIIPIITVALVSISHVTHWYAMSNTAGWAVYLSVGIEIAAMSALAAIAARMGKKVYFPFIIVTLIQFIGNIFFSYNFIDVTSASFISWKELVSPLLQLTGVEPTDLMAHKRFLAFFAGGLLPIISLSFLHMLIRFTEEDRLRDLQNEGKVIPEVTEKSIEPKAYDLVGEKQTTELIWKERDQEKSEPIDNSPLNLGVPITPNQYNRLPDILKQKYGECIDGMYRYDDTVYLKEEPVNETVESVITEEEIPFPENAPEIENEVDQDEIHQIISDHFWELDDEPIVAETVEIKEPYSIKETHDILPIENVYLYDNKLMYKEEEVETSPTPTPTPSVTPTFNPSVTPLFIPSVTPSNTPSVTPSNTPFPTPSITPSNTALPEVIIKPEVTPEPVVEPLHEEDEKKKYRGGTSFGNIFDNTRANIGEF